MKSRTPLKRSKPIARGKRPTPKRAKPRRSSALKDPTYLSWLRTQACAARFLGSVSCEGRIHAHHAGVGGRRVSGDDETLPLCRRHHIDGWHAASFEPFKSWTKAARREWASHWIADYRRLYNQANFDAYLEFPF